MNFDVRLAVLPVKHQAHLFFPARNKTIGLRTLGIINGPFKKKKKRKRKKLHNVHCHFVAHKALHLSSELLEQKLHN